MDREGILRELFPQVDARLIKAALLDGDDMESAVDFLIEEGMKYDQMANFDSVGTKVNFKSGNNQSRDGFTKVSEELDDSCFDKHEEAIVWKGIYQTNANNTNSGNEECGSNYQDLDGLRYFSGSSANSEYQSMNCWASGWPRNFQVEEGQKSQIILRNQMNPVNLVAEADDNDHTNSLIQSCDENANSILTQAMDVTTSQITNFSEGSSTGSGNCNNSTYKVQGECGITKPIPIIYTGDTVLTESNADQIYKDTVHISEDKIQSQGYPLSQQPTGTAPVEENESPKRCFDRNDQKHTSRWDSSLQEIHISDLDKLIEEAKCFKDNMRQETEELYVLRVTTEREETAAQVAKIDALNADLEILGKVEDLQNQLSSEKAKLEMRAVEIFGEKSVLSMEAREIKVRLEKTQVEQMKALEAINDVRHVLMTRLKSAAEEKNNAMGDKERKLRNAQERLAMEQASIEKVAQEYQALEAEAEMCKKLRDLLVERGSLVDSLQGEMAVLSEDIFAFKKQVDEGIPLSSSRYSTISSLSSKYSGSEGPAILKSVSSSASPVSSMIGSSTSDLPESIPPVECTLQSQYFSPTNSVSEAHDNKALLRKSCSQMVEGNQNEEMMQETRPPAIDDASQLDDDDWDVLGTNRN